jgi:hypothetical protein
MIRIFQFFLLMCTSFVLTVHADGITVNDYSERLPNGASIANPVSPSHRDIEALFSRAAKISRIKYPDA